MKKIYHTTELKKLLNNDWENISISKGNIEFDVDGSEYRVFYQSSGEIDDILLQVPKTFCVKLKSEIERNPKNYISHNNKDIKCLGDLSYLRKSSEFNL